MFKNLVILTLFIAIGGSVGCIVMTVCQAGFIAYNQYADMLLTPALVPVYPMFAVFFSAYHASFMALGMLIGLLLRPQFRGYVNMLIAVGSGIGLFAAGIVYCAVVGVHILRFTNHPSTENSLYFMSGGIFVGWMIARYWNASPQAC